MGSRIVGKEHTLENLPDSKYRDNQRIDQGISKEKESHHHGKEDWAEKGKKDSRRSAIKGSYRESKERERENRPPIKGKKRTTTLLYSIPREMQTREKAWAWAQASLSLKQMRQAHFSFKGLIKRFMA